MLQIHGGTLTLTYSRLPNERTLEPTQAAPAPCLEALDLFPVTVFHTSTLNLLTTRVCLEVVTYTTADAAFAQPHSHVKYGV